MVAEIPQADRDVFLEELARYSGDTVGSMVTASTNVSRLMLSPHVWRQHVYDLIQAIIEPEPLAWMDDDDAAFIPDLCRRSLDEIQLRFKQYAILTFIWIHNCTLADYFFCRTSSQLTPEARLSLICKIAQLPCLLAQCDKTDCTTQSTNNAFLTVLPYLPVITHLLDGPEDEVTPDIRRRVYLALLPILLHHNATEDLEPIVNILQRGVNDSDRSVRVSAG
jgi:serine/threonine-protein kinase ATR